MKSTQMAIFCICQSGFCVFDMVILVLASHWFVNQFGILLGKINSLSKGNNIVKMRYSWDITVKTLIKLYAD